jgi:phosphatidylserine decarboxylase
MQTYQVNLSEVEKPVSEYRTLNEFFCRHLKPGARPIFDPE